MVSTSPRACLPSPAKQRDADSAQHRAAVRSPGESLGNLLGRAPRTWRMGSPREHVCTVPFVLDGVLVVWRCAGDHTDTLTRHTSVAHSRDRGIQLRGDLIVEHGLVSICLDPGAQGHDDAVAYDDAHVHVARSPTTRAHAARAGDTASHHTGVVCHPPSRSTLSDAGCAAGPRRAPGVLLISTESPKPTTRNGPSRRG
jgi:hypothetical protein